MASSKEVIDEDEMSSTSSPVSNVELYVDAALQGKPKWQAKSVLKFVSLATIKLLLWFD